MTNSGIFLSHYVPGRQNISIRVDFQPGGISLSSSQSYFCLRRFFSRATPITPPVKYALPRLLDTYLMQVHDQTPPPQVPAHRDRAWLDDTNCASLEPPV
jgi:hypothetical protein